MDARLQALLDKQAITDLVYAYCSASDRHDHARLRELYHPDATDDHGGFFQGLASDFIDQLPEIQAPMEILHHNITNLNIALDGDYAEGEIYVLAFHRIRTETEPLDLLVKKVPAARPISVDDGEVRAIIEVEVHPERDGGFDRVATTIGRFHEVKAVYLGH